MKKKRFLLLGMLLVACLQMFAQLDANKTYTIVNRNNASLYVQDNGAGGIDMGSLNNNSYWQFEATGNTNCYYVKNANTGKYVQSCKNKEVEVQIGDTPVEYYIELKSQEGDGMYGLASTDQTTYNFNSGTIGWNWKDNNKVQGFDAVAGTNHRSFWKIEEATMPTPDPVLLFEANKTYTIESNNNANKFMQDNGDGYIVPAAKNNNSYWLFEATANEGCYYVKNAKTGKYMQKTSEYEVSVKTGDDPVEIYIKNDPTKGSNVFGLASTDRNPHDFASDDTYGANYTSNYVQGYNALLGGRANSFWKIIEEAMPQPIQGLSSPYAGVAPAVGSEYYLYNVKTGKWMGDNHTNPNGSWTSHGELGPRGRDIELKAGNADGRFILDPKLGNNHSINGSNLYMDTNDGVTNWIFTPVDVDGVTNCYTLSTPGGKAMGADANGYATSESGDIAENGNIWQLVSREQRLAAMQDGDDCSWLVLGGTFPVADSHREQDAYRVWSGDYGSNASGGDGFYHCNRVWELWGINDRDIYQDINVKNGKYKFKAQAIYVSTGNDDMNVDRYNEYLADPTGNTKGVVYANDETTPMINVYSLVTSERVDDRNTKEIASGVWAYNGTNEYSTNIFEGKGWTDEVEVEVKNGKLRVGAKVEGAGGSGWMLIDNFTLTYAGEIVVQDLTPYIEALDQAITNAENFNGETTDAIAAALASALDVANNVDRTDADAMTNATTALEAALAKAQAVDVKVLKATVALAEAEGITVPASIGEFLVSGTNNETENHLRLVRNLRKLNAIEKVDISMIECSEPANEEADYYLYNVGAGIFFSTTADWGTHIALDNPGMLIHFRPDGEWSGAAGRPVFHLSGNGWDGMNWQEEYWDKNGENKLAFVPVEGKDKVYNMCEWDNYNWHFVYDPAEDVCDGNTHYWNTVQKRDWNRNDYKDNPYAQWMLVSPAAYKAAMANASETKPLDVTYLIENPNFTKAKVDGDDNWDRGWTGVGGQMRGEGREPWMVIEWFENNANMTQTITGLTPGKYEVSCYGFYRDGSSDHEAEKVKNGEALIQNAFLTANGVQVALPSVTSEAGNMPGIGETRDGVSGEFACWPWQANQYFQTGLYKVTTPVVKVGADGQLTIGVESTYNKEAGSWVVVGNFRLTYLGGVVTIDENEDYVAQDVNDAVIVLKRTFATGDDDWNTFVVPFAISNDDLKAAFGNDVQVAEYSENSSDAHDVTVRFQTMSTPTVTANVPVLLKTKAAAGVYNFTGNVVSGNPVETGTNFDFVGNYAATMDVAAGDYFLNSKTIYKSEGATTLKGTRAYFKAKTAGARIVSLLIDEDDTTSINDEQMVKNESAAPVYNLKGQRVDKPTSGIYIQNGKKVVK